MGFRQIFSLISVVSCSVMVLRSEPGNIQLTLVNLNPFPVMNNVYGMLEIGTKQFRVRVDPGYGVEVSLNAADFAAVSDGDQIVLSFGAAYYFGPLNKSNLVYTEQMQLKKQAAIKFLQDVRNSFVFPQIAAALDAALQTLNQSLNSSYWKNPSHLNSNQTNAYFDLDRNALSSLQQALDTIPTVRENYELSNRIYGTTQWLLSVDRGLGEQVISDSYGGDAAKIWQARNLLTQGDVTGPTNFSAAVTDYQQARQHVLDGLPLTPTPTQTTGDNIQIR